MWFFETGVTYLLSRKYQNRCWVGITETWYTFSNVDMSPSEAIKVIGYLLDLSRWSFNVSQRPLAHGLMSEPNPIHHCWIANNKNKLQDSLRLHTSCSPKEHLFISCTKSFSMSNYKILLEYYKCVLSHLHNNMFY